MKPILIYDGSCKFCLYLINLWKNKTRDYVEYAPYQSVANQFPQIPLDQFERSVQLVKPNGEVTEGAKAVFETMSYNPGLLWVLRIYKNFPIFARISEAVYFFIAKRRGVLSLILRRISKKQ